MLRCRWLGHAFRDFGTHFSHGDLSCSASEILFLKVQVQATGGIWIQRAEAKSNKIIESKPREHIDSIESVHLKFEQRSHGFFQVRVFLFLLSAFPFQLG
jgi:hypothetical protein